jgi:hypothetical protein
MLRLAAAIRRVCGSISVVAIWVMMAMRVMSGVDCHRGHVPGLLMGEILWPTVSTSI